MDPRHLKRIKTVQNLFAMSFEQKDNLPYPDDEKTKKIMKKLDAIDKLVKKHAPRYSIDNIAKTDLAILRLSIYDLLEDKSQPQKVVINEAVEIAKELSSEKAYGFVNAVLGKILNEKIA